MGHGLEKGGKQPDGETLITGLSTARLRVPHLTRSGHRATFGRVSASDPVSLGLGVDS